MAAKQSAKRWKRGRKNNSKDVVSIGFTSLQGVVSVTGEASRCARVTITEYDQKLTDGTLKQGPCHASRIQQTFFNEEVKATAIGSLSDRREGVGRKGPVRAGEMHPVGTATADDKTRSSGATVVHG